MKGWVWNRNHLSWLLNTITPTHLPLSRVPLSLSTLSWLYQPHPWLDAFGLSLGWNGPVRWHPFEIWTKTCTMQCVAHQQAERLSFGSKGFKCTHKQNVHKPLRSARPEPAWLKLRAAVIMNKFKTRQRDTSIFLGWPCLGRSRKCRFYARNMLGW